MSGIHPGALLAVSRLVVEFRDDIGNPKTICGTGFWVQTGHDSYFVTNRHNVDPKLKLGADTNYRIANVKLQLRTQTTLAAWLPETFFVSVTNLEHCLRCHPAADVAVLKNPSLPTKHQVVSHSTFTLEELATEQFLAESASPMDVASFIGFPGRDGKQWWDQRWDLGIARTVNLASYPSIPFTNENIPTSDVILVSGLSFSGSSGSPVISHQKGIEGLNLGNALSGGLYIRPQILGMMSGHWWSEEPQAGMFFHSGLSYFTRATAIRELLDA